ncbi:putative spermidine/putrescine transport system permease protein [Pseudochelatococcus lubricantis]|uniref:Spermidine/putrescine transport system permease protein n=1 Tax=Pseudochelatococcus lubricantis TaxID=1538102 RepID=A0ABX0UTE3_9HYPH|nr:ABC transporter permease [Pseudochelatococcus lubricantis]NIJ56231.1 putative spermidine/putrescine transport system permease protein [Pseudochelatococcus lubricantis]
MSLVTVRKRREMSGLALGLYTVALLTFVMLPIVLVVIASFSSASFIQFPIRGWSLKWYVRAIEYGPFMKSLWISIQLAVASTLAGCLLGVPAALALARSRTAAARTLAAFLVAPISIPAIVLGFALLYYLSAVGIGVSFFGLWVAHTVVAIPYIARTVLAVYRSVPENLEEAAAILGASRLSTLRHVTLPMVRPGIFAGSMFAALISFDNLSLSFFFGSASATTLPVVMLSYMENQFDPAIAAISAIQMLIALAVLLLLERLYGLDTLVAA